MPLESRKNFDALLPVTMRLKNAAVIRHLLDRLFPWLGPSVMIDRHLSGSFRMASYSTRWTLADCQKAVAHALLQQELRLSHLLRKILSCETVLTEPLQEISESTGSPQENIVPSMYKGDGISCPSLCVRYPMDRGVQGQGVQKVEKKYLPSTTGKSTHLVGYICEQTRLPTAAGSGLMDRE